MDQLHALLFVLGQNYSQACEEVRGRFLLRHGVEVSDGSSVLLPEYTRNPAYSDRVSWVSGFGSARWEMGF